MESMKIRDEALLAVSTTPAINLTLVATTPAIIDNLLIANISANLHKNSQWPQWDTHEKNLTSKISCQTPFKTLSSAVQPKLIFYAGKVLT